MTTTPICNPHICRVLLGTGRFFGVLRGAVGYWDLLGYAEGRGYTVQGATAGWILWGNWGTLGVLQVL